MGSKKKTKKTDIEEEEKAKASTSLVVAASSDDDDEEANEDLSLKIVQKALLMRPTTTNPKNDVVLDGPSGITASEAHSEEIKTQKKKKKKKKLNSGIQSANDVIAEEDEAVETIKAPEDMEPDEAGTVHISDNVVLRKLLRGPRYFDPPAESGWGTCYNCGEEGHAAFNCTAAKRKKPCFLCGCLGHSVKQCTKARDCFICKKGGHRAKDCPEKHNGGSKSSTICLKCGNSGHDMFSCKNDYSQDDLKEMQCYVCKRFGHLCCVNTTDAIPREISCYKCGQMGHAGLACSRLRTETTDAAMPSLCYKCGEEGHFARECLSSVKPSSRWQTETTDASTPSSCYRCGEEGHFARECLSFVKASSRWQTETTDASTPSSCYKCGEEGHFARECLSSVKASSRWQTETTDAATPSSCYKCGEEGHFARECSSYVKVGKRKREFPSTETPRFQKENAYFGYRSAPHDMGKASKKKKPLTEERGITTPQKSKHRGGWMTEHPGEFSPSNSKRNSWRSPVTPYTKSTKIHSFSSGSHTPSSKSSQMRKVHDGISNSGGSAKTSHYRYSASRFGNSSSNGLERGYNW